MITLSSPFPDRNVFSCISHSPPVTFRRFCDDRMVCEYGCWAFSVFAGEGDATPDDFRFQTAAVKAGAMKVVARMVDVHLESASLRRQVCIDISVRFVSFSSRSIVAGDL